MNHIKVKGIFIGIQFRRSVMSDSLLPYEPQHTRLPCLSLSPRVCSNSYPLSHWCHPTISCSIVPFSSCPQSFSLSGFSKELALCIRWPKYWGFSFRISPSNEYSVDFLWIDCFDFLLVQGTLKSVLQQPDSKTSILPSQTLLWSNFPMHTWLLEKP